VDGDHVTSSGAAGQQRKRGSALVRGLNPVALQITLLTLALSILHTLNSVKGGQGLVVNVL